MPATVSSKYAALKKIIQGYNRVGVAFSGGIDSSLLLLAATEVLGPEEIMALHGRSVLGEEDTQLEELFQSCFTGRAQLEIIDLDPLSWPDFVNNDEKRCYHCKKKTYRRFLERLAQWGDAVLLDGTNLDDLSEERAGLAVLEELDIVTPLADAALGKKEIRFLGRALGLPHHDKPSNSCLATRLAFLPRIEAQALQEVAALEALLKKMGFSGCRARPWGDGLIIAVRNQDYLKICQKHNRLQIVSQCAEHGFKKVYLDLEGRS